jgi:hypothetical protein
MANDLVCRKCGAINNTNIVDKGMHHTAYCGRCGAYIKNVAYEVPKLYFGKYKNWEISKIEDLPYLEWFIKNIPKMTEKVRTNVQKQIDILKERTQENPKKVIVDFDSDSLDFKDFGGYENFKKMVHASCDDVCRLRFLEQNLQPEIYYFDRTTHSCAVEFFTLMKETENAIYLRRSGGAS